MTVYRHQGKWRYDFIKSGRRQRKGGFPTKQEARAAEAEARKNLKKINLDFLKLCESRLRDVQTRRSRDHFKKNHKLIKNLIVRWGQLKEITREDIEDYLGGLKSRSVANLHLRLIKALFNHGIEHEMTDYNPAGKIKPYPVSRKPKYIPPKEDILKVLEIAGRDKDYLLTVICTMGRIGEVNQLKWEDVHEDYLILRTRKSKNSDLTERKIPLNRTLKKVLKRTPKIGEYIFINPKTGGAYGYRKRLLKGLCKRAKVRRFGYHALRHYGASKLANEGEALTDIQALLGHQRATTTDVYLQSLRDSVKKAVKRLEI